MIPPLILLSKIENSWILISKFILKINGSLMKYRKLTQNAAFQKKLNINNFRKPKLIWKFSLTIYVVLIKRRSVLDSPSWLFDTDVVKVFLVTYWTDNFDIYPDDQDFCGRISDLLNTHETFCLKIVFPWFLQILYFHVWSA